MEKKLVICASPTVQKYYFEEEFKHIPESIKEEIRAVVAVLAQKTKSIISLGFYSNGNIYIEQLEQSVFDDEIGIAMEIKKFQESNSELLRSLRIWYMIYHMEEGKYVQKVLAYQSEGLSTDHIIEKITAEFGKEAGYFVEQILE